MIISKKNIPAAAPGVWERLPKVELHRHLEGSVTPELLLEISGKYGVKLPTRDLEALRRATQIRERVGSLGEFLQRFYLLGLAFPSVEAISEVAYRVCRDCARDRIRVLELRFSPVFMSIEQPHPWEEMVEAVWAGVRRAQDEFPIRVGLIIGVSRSNGLDRALEVVDLVVRSRDRGVLGIDLFGDEAQYPPELFAEPFAAARRSGLNITVHAGEEGG
nr:hypothetical protein [bacterium]